MKILFLSKHKYPHIGGVEKHIQEIGERIENLGHSITTISEEDIKPPHIKYLGLFYIWYWLFKNRKLITNSDIVHIHDVFIWYLPFRFIYPRTKSFVTFHGWEGKWPLTYWSILNKKIANKLSSGSIAVGNYINKYYGIKTDYVIHGGVTSLRQGYDRQAKTLNSIVYLGRQDIDTGINEFKEWFKLQSKKYQVKYITNEPSPEKYLKTAQYCVPAGYLSYLEAKNNGCKILTFANNPLKVDYWSEIKDLKKIPTWDEVVDIYLKLWRS